MPAVDVLPLHHLKEPLLSVAAFFEGEFSIDYVQAIFQTKATQVLRALDRFSQEGILKRHELGVFSFVDLKRRQELRESVPPDLGEQLHRGIADWLINETSVDGSLFQAAAQLLQINNDLGGRFTVRVERPNCWASIIVPSIPE